MPFFSWFGGFRVSNFGIYIVRGLADDGGVADGVLKLEALVAQRCAADRVEQDLRNMNAIRETDLSRLSPSILEYTKSTKIDDLVAKNDELVTESAAWCVLSFLVTHYRRKAEVHRSQR